MTPVRAMTPAAMRDLAGWAGAVHHHADRGCAWSRSQLPWADDAERLLLARRRRATYTRRRRMGP